MILTNYSQKYPCHWLGGPMYSIKEINYQALPVIIVKLKEAQFLVQVLLMLHHIFANATQVS